jgi:D-serine deaminase-like pyridoxal phosphate-dependent protein
MGCTETRSGSYIYEGMTRVSSRADLDPARCPLSIVCTVVSVPTADRIIIDGGQKTFRTRPPNPYGLIVEHPQALLRQMSVEHGHVDVSQCAHHFRVGEKVSVIPQHQGMATNMHDEAYGVRNGQVEVVWAIQGRGKVK